MDAIINVRKNSQYAKYNGLTFEVKDLLENTAGLIGLNKEFPKNQTDFSFKEIVIINPKLHLYLAQKALLNNPENNTAKLHVTALFNYCKLKNIPI
jgi:hypothetical protein